MHINTHIRTQMWHSYTRTYTRRDIHKHTLCFAECVQIFRGYWMAFFVWPAIFDSLMQYWPRRPPESNIGTSAKREGQYCLRAVAWANITLISQTWRVMRKKLFYNFFIITFPCKTSDYSVHNLLDRWKIVSDLDVLLKAGSFEVLSHWCGINNEVSSFSRSHIIVKYNLYGGL